MSNRFDNGHPFDTQSWRRISGITDFFWKGSNGAYVKGPLVPNAVFESYPTVSSWTSSAYDGTLLINKAIPTHPQAQFSTAVGEILLGGLPRAYTEYAPELVEFARKLGLPKTATPREIVEAAKFAGSAYLNVVWGYMPMVSDTLKLADSVLRAGEKINQYRANANRPIRRVRSLPPVTTVGPRTAVSSGVSLIYFPFYSWEPGWQDFFSTFGDGQGDVFYQDTVRTETWFVGSFSYVVPEGDDFYSQMDRYFTDAEKLFGVQLNAEVLWNIAPWSWFVDWNTNVGKIISNATRLSQDGLIMRYGYVMRKTVAHRVFTHTGVRFKNGYHTGPINVTFEYIRKERVRGNPFGFSLSPNSYNGSQWASLAALGLAGAGGNTVRAY